MRCEYRSVYSIRDREPPNTVTVARAVYTRTGVQYNMHVAPDYRNTLHVYDILGGHRLKDSPSTQLGSYDRYESIS